MSGARCVFVGNVPYDATEQSLATHFSQVGPVASVRLLFDKDTGKPRGFGFVEFYDAEHASSAVRNLNNIEFCGRSLRINIASNPPAGMGGPRDYHDSERRDRDRGDRDRDRDRDRDQQQNSDKQGSNVKMENNQLAMNPSVPEDEATRTTRIGLQIARTIESLSAELIYEIMRQLKTAIQNNPNEARNMLLQNPQLAYAVLQAQIQLGIVEPRVALAMLHRSAEQIPPLTAETHKAQLPERIATILTPASTTIPAAGGATHHPSFTGSPFAAPFSTPGSNPGQQYAPAPGSFGVPASGGHYGAPFSNQPPNLPFGAPPFSGAPPSFTNSNANTSAPRANEPEGDDEAEKRALLMQVLQLSDEQIAQLPTDQRNSVLALKEQLRRA